MKKNNVMKAIMAALAIAVAGLNANAQFGNLGNRIKQKAKQAVENKVESTVNNAVNSAVNGAVNKVEQTAQNAVSNAKQTINVAAEYKTMANRPTVDKSSSISDKYAALDYWMNLQEYANKKKDVEWLTSDNGEESTKVINLILNDSNKENSSYSYEAEYNRYKTIASATHDILYDGEPTEGEGSELLAAKLKWYVNKAKKGKENAKAYYTINGAAIRYLGFDSGKYSDTEEIQKQTKELVKLYENNVSDEYKAKYPNCNPTWSYDDIQTKKAEAQKAEEERKAAAAAKKKAQIEASKQTLKAGSLDKSLNAKVLKLAKQRVPGCIKVVVESSSWNVVRENGAIVRRTVLAWVVTKDDSGNLVANDYGFAQEYLGGGKYDALRNYSIGVRKVYVK